MGDTWPGRKHVRQRIEIAIVCSRAAEPATSFERRCCAACIWTSFIRDGAMTGKPHQKRQGSSGVLPSLCELIPGGWTTALQIGHVLHKANNRN